VLLLPTVVSRIGGGTVGPEGINGFSGSGDPRPVLVTAAGDVAAAIAHGDTSGLVRMAGRSAEGDPVLAPLLVEEFGGRPVHPIAYRPEEDGSPLVVYDAECADGTRVQVLVHFAAEGARLRPLLNGEIHYQGVPCPPRR